MCNRVMGFRSRELGVIGCSLIAAAWLANASSATARFGMLDGMLEDVRGC